jgi:protein ImuB
MVLWRNDPRRGRVVVACCPAAAALGVRSGIAIAQAMEILHGAPPVHRSRPTDHPASGDADRQVCIAEHDPIADAEAIERLAERLQRRISPLVAVEPLRRRPWAGQSLPEPETLFCDLSGVTHLFGDEAGVLAETHRCLGESGFTAKLAIADNAAAAWAHAHYNSRGDFISRDLVADLQPIDVCGLRLETEIRYLLDRLGIETIGSLLRLPRSGLASRLGDDLVRRIAEALGEVEVPLDAYHPDPQHRCGQALEYPTEDLDIIQHRIAGLCDELVAGLSPSKRGVLRLRCQLKLADRPPLATTIGLFAPTLDTEHLCGLVVSSVEALRLHAPITHIELGVVQADWLRTQQQSLFAGDAFAIDGDAVADQTLARLVDSLSIRLGREAVMGVRLTDNPLPEKAFRTYSLTDHRTRRSLRRLPAKAKPPRTPSAGDSGNRHAFRAPSRHDARRRPLKLLRTPVQLVALNDSAGSQSPTEDSPPAFRKDNQVHRVVHHWGPERIETAWWDGPLVRRDYFRVETATGHLWWVFRDLKTGRWYLHGRFA